MYYATELFIKKGAMGTIWLAATLWKKVNKKVVIESDIKELCSQVQEPPKPLAISTLAKLLFGIVKMHEYRVTVVLKKANESYIKVVKRVDRNINLQGTQLAANTDAITMVERPMGHFEDLQDIDIDIMDLQMKEPDFTMESAILRKPHHDLLAPDEAITMPDLDSSLRVKPRGLDLGLSPFGDLGDLDIELDLGIDDELEEQDAADLEISADPSLPEPVGTSGSERLELPDLTASPEPAVPSLVTGAPPIPSDHVSVGSVATPPPSHLDVGTAPVLPPESPERPQIAAEIPTQRPERDIVDRPRIQRPRRRRRRGVRFARDEVIEFEDSALRLDEDNKEELEQFTVPRPHVRHIDERSLNPGEFEQLFTSSLTGIFADSALRDGFRDFANMILNPRLETQRRRKDEEEAGEMMPVPRMEVDDEERPGADALDQQVSRLTDLSVEMPEIPRAEPSAIAIPSDASSVARSGSDLFAGYRLGDIAASSSSAAPLVLPSDRRLDALADVTESVDGTDAGVLKMGQMVEMEVDALRGKRARRGLKSSSEEMTVPQELSKLTAFFKYILDGEIRKLEAERDEEPVKVELGEMLKFHAEKNGSVINKRDMALGFLQTLILKTADIIDVEQNRFDGEIYLFKGPDFDRQIAL